MQDNYVLLTFVSSQPNKGNVTISKVCLVIYVFIENMGKYLCIKRKGALQNETKTNQQRTISKHHQEQVKTKYLTHVDFNTLLFLILFPQRKRYFSTR